MNILLTNDDGIYAKGLWALFERLSSRHRVTVIAPDRERSGVGHGITLHAPLRANRVEVNGGHMGFAVNGTPVDCVRLGITEITTQAQDLVISGINPGRNVGAHIHYSGTVSAAREAALSGVPAISVSVCSRQVGDYGRAARFTASLARKVAENGLPFGTMLNVNIPEGAVAGVRISRQGLRPLAEAFEKRVDPRNGTYYWTGPDTQIFDPSPDVDGSALADNFISITPITCDSTDYRFMEDLKTWGIDPNVHHP